MALHLYARISLFMQLCTQSMQLRIWDYVIGDNGPIATMFSSLRIHQNIAGVDWGVPLHNLGKFISEYCENDL